MARFYFTAFILVLCCNLAIAQTCIITPSTRTVCIGNTVTFSATVSGGTPLSYSWNFGDMSTSTQAIVVHTYLAVGTYTPTLTINFQGGGTCTATGPTVQVVALPRALFSVLSNDTICFKNNELCILDSSKAGPSGAPITQRVFQLNNGHIEIAQAPINPLVCYQNTTDFFGRLYTTLIEVTDTNGCVARKEIKDSIYLLPRNQDISFSITTTPGCDSTRVNFVNTSLLPLNQVKSFVWDFGDGTVDASSTRWTNFNKFYKKNGVFSPKLIVTDRNNCIDTFELKDAAVHQSIDTTMNIENLNTTPLRMCYANQVWNMGSRGPGAKLWQIFKDTAEILRSNTDIFDYSFPSCGVFRVRLSIQFANCTFNKDTFITILGPKTILEDSVLVQLKNQCEPHDSVRFRTPVPEFSEICSPSVKWFWDFGNPIAPPCTTNTRLGQNVGQNCRYSTDSILVAHYYSEPTGCYKASLQLTDTITGCSHTDSVRISIGPPNAGWDSTSTPIRRGLYYTGNPCLNTNLTFFLDSVLPFCGFERAWINFDTACSPKQWNLLDTTRRVITAPYLYSDHCNPNGQVVVGLVLRNGLNAQGQHCYDTAYYPFFRFIKKDAQFDFTKLNNCPPYNVRISLQDTFQPNIRKVFWGISRVFPDGSAISILDTSYTIALGDSLLPSFVIRLPNNGRYNVFSGLEDIDGCFEGRNASLSLGFEMGIGIEKEVVCVGQPTRIFDFVRYYDPFGDQVIERNFWGEADRNAAGKEQLFWDIGDGNGFSITGSEPAITYTKPGTYTIRLVAKDSLNCYDTLVLNDFVTAIELKANIWTKDSSYLCAPQIVVFRDTSSFLDANGNPTANVPDFINEWIWDFADGKQPSLLQHPSHNYTANGVFDVKLIVNSIQGCSDTAFQTIRIRGPEPKFELLDSVGCVPFDVTFINTTGQQLLSWTWFFGDDDNTILSTQSDTNVRFTYNTPGIYRVRLLGVDTLLNPATGNLITCTAIFPDTLTNLPSREVFVQFTPEISLTSLDTVCPNEEVVFTISPDPIYNAFTWYFTANDSVVTQLPDTVQRFTYTSAGVYNVVIIPQTSVFSECIDTLRKDIVVLDVKADFEVNDSRAPEFVFENKSTGAVRYEWYLQKESKDNPFSTERDARHRHQGSNFSFEVCLVAYNIEDCWDSVCKEVYYFSDIRIPNVFTPGGDGVNDAFDIEIAGQKKYDLVIYNRWGGVVFRGDRDGEYNDGVNWNGRLHNEGDECAAGVYYYIFTYQFLTDTEDRTVHGTVTLIR
jgi:gliding motility-associated-like protein